MPWPPDQARRAAAVPRLGAASRRTPVVLVLDDVHLLRRPEPLAALIDHVREGSAIVLAGRGEAAGASGFLSPSAAP